MICDRSICGNSFDVPEVMVTIADRNSGAAWGYYCSHSCAMIDSDTILSHLGDDKDIGSLEGITIDASNVNQVTQTEVPPVIPVPILEPQDETITTGPMETTEENASSALEADTAFEDLLQQEEEIEQGWQQGQEEATHAPTPEQAVMDHVVQNTPQDVTAVQALRDSVIALFTSNLGLIAEPETTLPGDGQYTNLRMAAGTGVASPDIFMQVVISSVDTVQILFGDGDVNNMQIDPEAVSFDEVSGFLLQKVGEKMQQTNTLGANTASPDEPF